MSEDFRRLPIDEIAAAYLVGNGLRLATITTTDDAFPLWLHAVNRGFHGPRATDEIAESRREPFAHRRIGAIYDDSIADAATPVGTTSSWIMDMTVPGHRVIPTWAISTVTTAPTHRRRGIGRSIIESELRTAVRAGVPAAILTASEGGIYERFGFAPAAMRANWTIDTRTVKWIGPVPDGRVQLVTSEQARDGGGFDVIERARLGVPGQVAFDGMLWDRLFGAPGRGDPADFRVARYDDAEGVAQGVAIYKAEGEGFRDKIWVNYFGAATDDAYAALWRYLIELDLVDEVKAELRSTDEPLRWQLSDPRSASVDKVGDHLWLRILDVKATLEARHYAAPGTFVLEVTDDLGFADGCYLVSIDNTGTAAVRRLDDTERFGENHHLLMSVNELAAAYLGATSFGTLVRSGRVNEKTPAAAIAADAAFRSAVTPWLSIWF